MRASKIREELKRISRAHGGILKPAVVVKAAEDKRSILHDCFEWDDSKAGRAYRLWQARQLISVSVEYSEVAKEKYDVFVSLSSDRKHGNGYREVEQVLSDKTLRIILLNDALNEMNIFIEKYSKLKELSKVFEVMRKVRKKYMKKK